MTTIEQAISHYKYGISHDIFAEPVTTYAQLSIEALEKQQPKKVIKKRSIHQYTYMDELYCPSCEKFIGFPHTTHQKFCHNCGQALDWGE